MEGKATVRTQHAGTRRPPAAPPAIWSAFVAQAAWRNWTIVALLGVIGLLSMVIVRLASRPPEVVLLDAAGNATPVRRSVATDALLKFLAERNRPPEATVTRFTRDFLHLAVAVNSSTIDAAWPAALVLMSPELRDRVGKEAVERRLLETYRLAQRKTELMFEEIILEERTPSVLAVRATLRRRTGSLVEGAGPAVTDRVQVDLIERIVPATLDRPDGLEVAEWRLTPLLVTDSSSKPGEKAKGVSDAP
jgi:hypothetical protein